MGGGCGLDIDIDAEGGGCDGGAFAEGDDKGELGLRF
jgi:hypothetical protein